jgi:hypothetical protein
MKTTPRWRSAMKRALDQPGLTQGWLANEVLERTGKKLWQPDISLIKNGERAKHWAVHAISEILQIDLPAIDDEDADGSDEGFSSEDPHGSRKVPVELTASELERLDEWAIESGYVKGTGNPNRSAALKALVRALLMPDEKTMSTNDDAAGDNDGWSQIEGVEGWFKDPPSDDVKASGAENQQLDRDEQSDDNHEEGDEGGHMKHDITIAGRTISNLTLKAAMLEVARAAVASGIHPTALRFHEGTPNAKNRWTSLPGCVSSSALARTVNDPKRWFLNSTELMFVGNETWALRAEWSWDVPHGTSREDLERIQKLFPKLGLTWTRY